jgi:hypothetical protein
MVKPHAGVVRIGGSAGRGRGERCGPGDGIVASDRSRWRVSRFGSLRVTGVRIEALVRRDRQHESVPSTLQPGGDVVGRPGR